MVNYNCDQLSELLDAYHDNELPPNERESVAQHVSECSACSGRLADISRLARSLSSLPRMRPSRDFIDNIDFDKLLSEDCTTAEPSPTVSIQDSAPARTLQPVAAKQPLEPTPLKIAGSVTPLRSRAIAGGVAGAVAAVAVVFAAMLHKPEQNPSVANLSSPEAPVVATSSANSGTNPNSLTTPQLPAVPPAADPVVNSSNNASTTSGIVGGTDRPNGSSTTDPGFSVIPKRLVTPEAVTPATIPPPEAIASSSTTTTASSKPDTIADSTVSQANCDKEVAIEIAALSDDDSVCDSLGIATDEDGLYDIKI